VLSYRPSTRSLYLTVPRFDSAWRRVHLQWSSDWDYQPVRFGEWVRTTCGACPRLCSLTYIVRSRCATCSAGCLESFAHSQSLHQRTLVHVCYTATCRTHTINAPHMFDMRDIVN